MEPNKKRGRKENPARTEARHFVGGGELRQVLERNGRLSQEAINKIVDAASFVLKA